MALKHVLLGIIALFGPRSGYTLHKDIFAPRRPSTSQVYHALKILKKENLVDYNRVYGPNEPSKNIYQLLPEGREELARWLREKDFATPMYEPLMQKIWFGSSIDSDNISQSLRSFIAERQEEIKYYEHQKKLHIGRPSRQKSASSTTRLYWSLVFDYVITRANDDIKWAKRSIDTINDNMGDITGYTKNRK